MKKGSGDLSRAARFVRRRDRFLAYLTFFALAAVNVALLAALVMALLRDAPPRREPLLALAAATVLSLGLFLTLLLGLRGQLKRLDVNARTLLMSMDVPSQQMGTVESALRVMTQTETALKKDIADQLLLRNIELDAWQHQINPHFLYNTLESIRGQALEDNSLQAAEMIELLGRLLRYILSRNSNMCTIDQELKCVDSYFRIQQYRFYNRFRLEKNIDMSDLSVRSYKIPKLTLQPLIENAIYHGLDSIDTPGLIKINITNTESRLIISVSDNGVGIPPARLKEINQALSSYSYTRRIDEGAGEPRIGIALQNINARIKLLYGQAYGITVFSAPNPGSQVVITLPMEGVREA